MTRLKILFADDQIPDERIADDDVVSVLKREHPDWSYRFLSAFPIMRQAVTTLRDAGYDVTVARTAKDALSLAKNGHFDLAIIDMGWYGDDEVPETKQPNYGWDICDAIDKTDKRLGRTPTPQIAYSNRFERKPGMSIQAASKGILPVFKIYSEAGHRALEAAVGFIKHLIERLPDPAQIEWDFLIQLKKQILESLAMPLKQQKQWFKLTIFFVALSISLLLVGSLGAIFWNVQVGTLTSISSVLSGLISSLLYRQLQKSQKAVETSQQKVLELYAEATQKLEHLKRKNKP